MTTARRRLDPAERKAQILAAARIVFSEKPYDMVSANDIAAEAGVTRGLITHYFGSKRGLFLEAVRQMLTFPPGLLEDLPATGFEQRIAIAIDRFLDAVERNKGMWLAAINASAIGHDSEVERITFQAYERDVDGILKAVGMADIEQGRTELRAMIRSLAGLVREASKEWLIRGTLTRGEVHVVFADLLTHVISETFPAVMKAKAEQT